MDRFTKFKKTHIARISINEITGKAPALSDLIEIFKELPAERTLNLLSCISVSFANQGLKKTEEYLRKEILHKDFQSAISTEENRNGSRISLFNQMTLFLLVDLCRLYSPISDEFKLTNGDINAKVGFAFIVGNYFANLSQEADSEISKEEYVKFSIREGLFNETDQVRYSLGRAKLIYELLASKLGTSKKFDVSAFLKTHYGFTLDDYFQTLVALHSQWSSQKIESWDISRNYIDLTTFFNGASNYKDLQRVIAQITQDWNDKPKGLFETTNQKQVREYLYSQFKLKAMPLIKIESRVFPTSMHFLKMLCWSGPYYLVIDKLREIRSSPDPFFHYLGDTTEQYCKSVLKQTFKKKLKIIDTILKNPLGECVLEINPKWHVIFEVKAKRPNLDAIVGNKSLNENSSIDMMFVQPLDQISKRIMEHRRTFSGKISPVLITGGSMFLNEISWKEYFNLVKDLPMFSDSKIDTPILLDLETLEILCACVQRGYPISEIIRAKNSPIWEHDDFKNFLYFEYLPKKKKGEPVLNSVADASSQIFEDLRKRLFPNSEKLPDHDDTGWKKAFELL